MEPTSVASRDKRDDKRPREDENVSKRGVPGCRGATKVLNDVEPMTSNDVFWNAESGVRQSPCKTKENKNALTQSHLQHGNSHCYRQVDDNFTTFLQEKLCERLRNPARFGDVRQPVWLKRWWGKRSCKGGV